MKNALSKNHLELNDHFVCIELQLGIRAYSFIHFRNSIRILLSLIPAGNIFDKKYRPFIMTTNENFSIRK